MKEIIDKLTSYNLFNYLLPGTLFVVMLEKMSVYSFSEENLVIAAFLYYFVGLVISRFGSLIVEPFLKKIKFLKFTDYKSFVAATKKDERIEVFSEVNNMFRTFTSMFILFFVLKIYKFLEYLYPILKAWNPSILAFLLLIMFLCSYKKQTDYISKRIKTTEE